MELVSPVVGNTYEGTITRILDFGAVVEIMPGYEGLLHISQIAEERVNAVSDRLKQGQVVRIKVIEMDDKGRVRLSMRGVPQSNDIEEESVCSVCGSAIEIDALFCTTCGAKLRNVKDNVQKDILEKTIRYESDVIPDVLHVVINPATTAKSSNRSDTCEMPAINIHHTSTEYQALGDMSCLETDQWLLASCRELTSLVLKDIIGRWNPEINAIQNSYSSEEQSLTPGHRSAYVAAERLETAVEKEIALEKQEHMAKLQEVEKRFSGLSVNSLLPALQEEVQRINCDGNHIKKLSADGMVETSHVEAAFHAVDAIQSIEETESQLTINECKRTAGPTFIISFISLWFLSILGASLLKNIIHREGLIPTTLIIAVLTALLVTIVMLVKRVERVKRGVKEVHSAITSLVSAIATRHAWLDTVMLLHSRSEAHDMRKRADQALFAGQLQVSNRFTERCSALLASVEVIANDISEALERIYKVGGFNTAETTICTSWTSWECATSHAGVVRLGMIYIPTDTFNWSHRVVIEKTRMVQGFGIPLLASLRNGRSIYMAIKDHTNIQHAYGAARNAIFRIIATAPPAKVLFTFVDPIGQGQNVASFLALGDYDESLVNIQAWTDPRQIERKLTDLTEHMETVIQKYLRSDYKSIDDYNNAAGEIAEPYRVVVIFDFPECITENAARQLERIVQNGGRCGVYAIVIHDLSKIPSYGVNTTAITKHSLAFYEEGGRFYWDNYGLGKYADSVALQLDNAPPEELIRRVLKTVGEAAKTALKVEVPYAKLLQLSGIGSEHIWNQSTIDGIRVPLGPGSARKPRLLELGVGLSVHALVIGRPGSGKSNLMHVVISTAARMYSPNELQLYLIDFKEGVEFKPYAEAGLPHARVIAIKSEREFGLSILRKLDEELKTRSEAFRRAGVQDFRQYRNLKDDSGKTLLMPRILLLIDEFQEFFIKQDALSDEAALLLDRIVRQGRAFGIHMLLGSQTINGYSLPRATLNLITVRIALQSSEADSRMILADDNTAARHLTRPGEGIYNASSGLIEGNNLFQVALFDDTDRNDVLDVIKERLTQARNSDEARPAELFSLPLVFEGHEPAVLSQSKPLLELLSRNTQPEQRRAFEVWLGEPIEIKSPTSFIVSRRAGSHLLVVSKNEEEAVGVLCAAMLGLILQNRPGKVEIPIVDLTTADASWADMPEDLESLFPLHGIKVHDRRSLPHILQRLSDLIRERIDDTGTPDTTHFLIVLGMQRARDLRQQESFSRLSIEDDEKQDLSAQLSMILRDGPECGVHVLVWCDSVSNLEKALDRRVIGEFGTRVVGQMNSSDLRTLVEDEAVSSRLERPHRLVKYEEERVGVLETFRPYGLPDRKWLKHVAAMHSHNQ